MLFNVRSVNELMVILETTSKTDIEFSCSTSSYYYLYNIIILLFVHHHHTIICTLLNEFKNDFI